MHSSQREDRLTELESFVLVARLSSFVAAANEMDLSTATLSRRIARLERRVGVRLLNRSTRQVSLTEAGAAYLDGAEDVLHRLAQANATLAALGGRPAGRLRMSVPNVFGQMHIAPHLPEFLERYPEIRLDVTFSDHPVDLVADRFDMAVRIGPVGSEELVVRKLAPIGRVLCATPALLRQLKPIRHPDDLRGLPTAHFSPMHTGAAWSLHCGQDSVLVPLEARLRADNVVALHEAARAGAAIAMLASFIATADLHSGRLVEVLPQWKPVQVWACAVYPSHRMVAGKVRAMVDFLVEKLGAPMPSDAPGGIARDATLP
jgi:DNA-binding transcriptional LysR family regulator